MENISSKEKRLLKAILESEVMQKKNGNKTKSLQEVIETLNGDFPLICVNLH